MKQVFYKIIYQPAINSFLRGINKAVYPILPKKIKLTPSGIVTIKNGDGASIKIKTNQTNFATRIVYWDGYLNFEYTPIFIGLIRKVDVFYDVGANIGYYTLLAKMENSDIEVVGFEPAQGPLHYYRENIRINNLDKVKIESVALSEKEGELTFYEMRNKKYSYLKYNLAGDNSADTEAAKNNVEQTSVKTTTFDDYVSSNNVTKIDLVKIDTEGTEHLILSHADSVLGDLKPIIICETLFNTNEAQLESIFKKFGYEFYNHVPEGLVKVESITREKDNGVRNCFFVHPDKKELIEEFIV